MKNKTIIRKDLYISIIISLIMPIIAFFIGDVLYVGIWYYLVLPTIFIIISLLFRIEKYFLSGISFALFLTYFIYFIINMKSHEGLLVLGHLFSIPGVVITFISGLIFAKKFCVKPSILFIVGFLSIFTGFFMGQITICNTLMYCGSLSWI